MSRIFHHDNILVLSMNEQAQTRLSYELSSNDCEVRQVYNLTELEEVVGESPTLCLVIYLDSLSPALFDTDLYKEFADQFFLIVIDDLGEDLPREQLEEIPFTTIINKEDEASLYDIGAFIDEFYGEEEAA
ncbi:hypothetical protein [Halobacteriovorax sp. JY17]|uniref:hypothetical protein n=1 Tax=Halobacteriovorax sp. JY17 TaxID=2014617 RepID=UPI000C41CE55|nr:hypothetical protein [Halobacteriovorax sp. JY17]PIK16375.1 MAG: hypothetical protein CES88_06430 [Halobacteriovorax sp. JY17]